MTTNSLGSGLIFGIAALGLTVLVAGVKLYRRQRSESVVSETQVGIKDEGGTVNENPNLVPNPPNYHRVNNQKPNHVSRGNRPLTFFLLLFVITIPYWVFGGKNLPIPIKLPVSAFAAFNPMIAGLILTYLYEGYTGVKALLSKAFDYRKIKNRNWYIPILFLSPLVYVLSYAVMILADMPLPDPEIPILMAPVFFGVFIVFAIGEELGWMGYAIDPLQSRWGALNAAVIVGIIWGLFHLIPDLQNKQTADWILWQRLGSVFLRIIMVWIYNNTGRSVFSSVLFHAMNNLSWTLFPNYGSHYDPFITGVILLLVTGLVIIGWDAKTLAHYRFARNNS